MERMNCTSQSLRERCEVEIEVGVAAGMGGHRQNTETVHWSDLVLFVDFADTKQD